MIRVFRSQHVTISRLVQAAKAEGCRNGRRKMSDKAEEKSSSLSKPLVQLLIGGGLAVGAGYAYSKYSESQSSEGSGDVAPPAPGLMITGSHPAASKKGEEKPSTEAEKMVESKSPEMSEQVKEEAPSGMSGTKLAVGVTVPLVVLIAAWIILNNK